MLILSTRVFGCFSPIDLTPFHMSPAFMVGLMRVWAYLNLAFLMFWLVVFLKFLYSRKFASHLSRLYLRYAESLSVISRWILSVIQGAGDLVIRLVLRGACLSYNDSIRELNASSFSSTDRKVQILCQGSCESSECRAVWSIFPKSLYLTIVGWNLGHCREYSTYTISWAEIPGAGNCPCVSTFCEFFCRYDVLPRVICVSMMGGLERKNFHITGMEHSK